MSPLQGHIRPVPKTPPHPFFRHDMPTGHHGHHAPHHAPVGFGPRPPMGPQMRYIDQQFAMVNAPVVTVRDTVQQPAAKNNDVIQNIQPQAEPVLTQPVPSEPAKKYRDLISSAVYFTNDKWQECLESHGIKIDAENRKLHMTQYGKTYDLTAQQVKDLTSNKLKGDSVYHRIDVINGVIGKDFDKKLSFDILNSKEQADMMPKSGHAVAQDVYQQYCNNPNYVPLSGEADGVEEQFVRDKAAQRDPRIPGMDNPDGVNGQSMEGTGKGWYRQMNGGREVNVGEIWVEKDAQHEGKFKMSAVINGNIVSHEISQKQHDKFLALDDMHRFKMFDKVFNEVQLKSDKEAKGEKMNFGQALITGLGVMGAMARGAGDVVHEIERIKHPHGGPAPDLYAEEHHRHGRIYVKAGLDTPESIASRAFEAGMNQGFQAGALHR